MINILYIFKDDPNNKNIKKEIFIDIFFFNDSSYSKFKNAKPKVKYLILGIESLSISYTKRKTFFINLFFIFFINK